MHLVPGRDLLLAFFVPLHISKPRTTYNIASD